MVMRTLGWRVLMGLGTVACAFGCSDDFHDIGDVEQADAGASAGSGGNAGDSGDAERAENAATATGSTETGAGNVGNAAANSSAGGATAGTVTGTTGGSSPGPAVTSASTTGGIASPSCIDDILNFSESDVDCGGPYCLPCPEGSRCYVDSDCEEQVCVDNVCEAATTCNDGERNGDETDADCGGACPPCVAGAACLASSDCASGRCVQSLCEEERAELDDCSSSPAAEVGFGTEAELEALLLGAWLLCPEYANDPSEREPRGVVGVEFTSDYRYTYLLEEEDGQLVRGQGLDFTGDWYIGTEAESSTTGGDLTPLLIRPETADSRTYYRPTFTEGPVQLRLQEYFGLFHASRYVPIELAE